MSLELFISDTVLKCEANNINFKLINAKSQQGSSGYFDQYNLVSCTKVKKWVGILVHESCHLDQYIENKEEWDENTFNVWDKSLAKKNPRKYTKEFKKLCELEIDCDKRAVAKIKKYRLQKEVGGLKYYIQGSNCYHASYFYFRKYLCFYKPGKPPYDIKEICDLFPKNKILDLKEIWRPRRQLGDYILANKKEF